MRPAAPRITHTLLQAFMPAALTALASRSAAARRSGILVGLALLLTGCEGIQSALSPAGVAAERVAELFWWLVGGATLVWLLMVGLGLYAVLARPGPHPRRQTTLWIIGGGTVFPTVVLAVYLAFGLSMMPDLLDPPPEGSLTISVTGEQWWWRVHYELPDGEVVELANEIHLPVGEPVRFVLTSPDVIHSFWIPSLGGKMDMIPGRVTYLTLEPTRTGVFRGACAEYCGAAHAMMSFFTVVQEREDFDAWLAHQATPAQAPTDPTARLGRDVFLASGCGACHAIRGTEADGVLGPDLTHVGSRLSLAAATLPNEPDDFLRWIAHTKEIKPDVHMPAFDMLPPPDLRALAVYLKGLE